jgi:peptidoglycan/LPS O-acetylase OafA/YrhL
MKQASRVKIGDRSAGNNNNFNLLRMMAATGVLISHAYPISLGADASQPLATLLKGLTLGNLCVMIFFSISGFFIARSFARKSSLRSFLRARALRLFPALMVVLAVTVIVAATLSTASAKIYWSAVPEYYLRNLSLFFLKYELPGVFTTNPYGGAINGSLWTLNYEVLCYMGVVVCGLLGFLGRPALFGLGLAGFAIAYGFTMMLDLHSRIEALMSLALPFAVGMSFWVWRDRIPLTPSLAAAGGLVATLAWLTPIFIPVFTLAVSYAVFVLGYARLSWAMSYNRIGDYSYGTYVYAFPIQQSLAWYGVVCPLWNMAIATPLTLFCAVLSWHFVESQALKWKRVLVSERGH